MTNSNLITSRNGLTACCVSCGHEFKTIEMVKVPSAKRGGRASYTCVACHDLIKAKNNRVSGTKKVNGITCKQVLHVHHINDYAINCLYEYGFIKTSENVFTSGIQRGLNTITKLDNSLLRCMMYDLIVIDLIDLQVNLKGFNEIYKTCKSIEKDLFKGLNIQVNKNGLMFKSGNLTNYMNYRKIVELVYSLCLEWYELPQDTRRYKSIESYQEHKLGKMRGKVEKLYFSTKKEKACLK